MAKVRPMPPIIIDTRERTPLEFKGHATEVRGLKTGDYSLDGCTEVLCLERKMPRELFSMCTGARPRFERELERMQAMNAKPNGRASVIIEGSMAFVIASKPKQSKLKPATVLRAIASWETRFGVPFHFAGGKIQGETREHTAREYATAWTFTMLAKWWQWFGDNP